MTKNQSIIYHLTTEKHPKLSPFHLILEDTRPGVLNFYVLLFVTYTCGQKGLDNKEVTPKWVIFHTLANFQLKEQNPNLSQLKALEILNSLRVFTIFNSLYI